jgi:valyl-tRNA synthetase
MTTSKDNKQVPPTTYDPAQVEQRLYQNWLQEGYFSPTHDPDKNPFVIIQPPPNVTGELHLGHAQRVAVEDALTRWHRMRGEPTLWLPGLDHAGIATQVVVERQLAKEGLSRHELGRQKFVERVWEWVDRYRGRIQEQQQRLGASCDWSRETFTLDPKPSQAVRHTFVNLYRKGLIYRGERIINWCIRCSTALSDLEVEYQEQIGELHYIRYLSGNNDSIVVATTRPETMLGDTAIAVHPDDTRYRNMIGKTVYVPIIDRPIPIIADSAVDPELGTGALKVTPGHAVTDFEIGQRHSLDVVNAISPDGTITTEAGAYSGIDRLLCRTKVLETLQFERLLEKSEPTRHSVGHCQRCREVVEPLISKQWFLQMEPLAKPALAAVESGEIQIIPDHFARVYKNWMENIRDWCISRQLWWGHRIPVWYCDACAGITVDYEDPQLCQTCGSLTLSQDPDVLDTWFSSGLWPHSTLGWPEDTHDLNTFYPTSVMETGYDILFFWVARMIMLGIENTGKPPFKTVYLSGLIRDPEGVKMSKTRGNVIDPVEAINTYGADALRFALTNGNAAGNDARIGPDKLESARNFANKLWNATRYVLQSLDNAPTSVSWANSSEHHLQDKWILSRHARLVERVSRALNEYHLGEAEQAIHEFLWGDFCDWYIEVTKIRLRADDLSPLPILAKVLESTLRLLHPFMPFITEELWQHLTKRLIGYETHAPSIMVAPYPECDYALTDERAEADFGTVMDIIRAIRNVRAELHIEPTRPLDAFVHAGNRQALIEREAETICSLARLRTLRFFDGNVITPPQGTLTLVVGTIALFLPLGGIINIASEQEKLRKDQASTVTELENVVRRVSSKKFLERAPREVVEKERAKEHKLRERTSQIKSLLERLDA